MVTHLYKLECLTNLHVGSGEANYNIIDKEVERDPITKYPIIHASGIKGALREYFAENKLLPPVTIDSVFGKASSATEFGAGTYKFFDAHLLSRPMRVGGTGVTIPCINVTSDDILRAFLTQMENFGIKKYANVSLPELNFGGKEFLSTNPGVTVEDEETGVLDAEYAGAAAPLLGSTFAVVKNFSNYALPVVAHNKLEHGESKNLWYEEYVPHGSVFWLMILTPDEKNVLELEKQTMLQFGANASIGYGFVKITKLI
ncbi:MAG: type III-B CRISPR module RAMP protein Cmr4 [Clostridia bacterium]|nr:type III-B CRISPR module RAMP protein Cmr4 [Clostridia bacterium]